MKKPFDLRIPFFLAFSALLLPMPSQAQDTPALPAIAPREFEIRGELVVQFPALERQPLTGFNPPPRVYEIPDNRRPFIGSYRLDAASLPPSPLRPPESPPAALTIGGSPNGTRIEGSVGSLFTRALRFDLYRPYGNSFLYTRVAYDGSDGHTIAPDTTAPYESVAVRIGWEAAVEQFNAGFEATGSFDAYRLYGAAPSANTPADGNPWRNGTSGGVSGWLRSGVQTPLGYELALDYVATRSTTFALAGETGPSFQRSDKRLAAQTELITALGHGRIEFTGNVKLGIQDENALVGKDDLTYDTGALLRFTAQPQLDLALGARAIGISTSEKNGDRWANFIGPDVRIGLRFSNHLKVYFQNVPLARSAGMTELLEENPYLVDEPRMQGELALLNAQAGFTLNTDPVRLEGRVGYVDYRSYRFFEPDAPAGYDAGFFRTTYEPAQLFEAGGSLTLLLGRAIHTTARLAFRDGKLTRNDEDIPYLAPFTAGLALSALFNQGKGLLQIEGTSEGARPTDRTATRKLDPYVRLDLSTSYDVTERLALYIRLRNVLNVSYARWEGYPAPPLVALGGLRVRW